MLGRKIDIIRDHPFDIEVDESIKAPKKQQRNRGARLSIKPMNSGKKRNRNKRG